MTNTRLVTVGDAIAALSAYDPTTLLRVATQPGFPMEHFLARVVCSPVDAESDGIPPANLPVVWLGVGERVGSLPESGANALGWSW
ncbi:hypothetical protein ACQPZF_10615 [Actinosynnema sp. CS-041913]|uniref:hypothetical protein n=1 Tax=Actinosynnema sp. CS-041913 TaxID=3239917 RepID=UPI003D8E17A0